MGSHSFLEGNLLVPGIEKGLLHWQEDSFPSEPPEKPMMPYMCVCLVSRFSHVRFFSTLWTIARQAPLSMGFSRQEYWSGLSCPPPGDLPHPGIEPVSLMFPALADGLLTTSATWEHIMPSKSIHIAANGKVSLF